MFPLLANLITVFRIVLIFCLLPLMINHQYPWQFVLIFQIIFLAAIITDYLDGYIARKYKQQTVFGKFFDPIADKLLVIIALFYLGHFRFSKPPILFIIPVEIFPVILMIIVIREFLVTGVRLLASDKGIVVSASFWGKAKTLFTFLAIFFLFFGLYCNLDLQTFFPKIFKIFTFFNKIGDIFLILAIFLTIISGVDYFYKNYHIIVKNFSPQNNTNTNS
ncbi:CDP-diacylglycerol--glycerol-3-phosphate 3-phosphatidyltransferase ['Fragaria x ananassa' phyllody phytoplasma]|uniref:CDP-diacylglycerol--glycerol-3-phosphate 3-phosphatidyltransferase n=1 Tax='Fragaria x ananassa' phyllody phytoplasma TaxID=2358428 RepID=A0ABS5K2V0_9MOLU|nr:CDP-diacylglycerol--glycerol-3-phosphate 3-phosphatidyltransferase ['Fragaria x ananassa' phyllody phytoplasma]MBS2126183.1 CDP-diacylglycerol--glycerol-3-phosphate 3-phosphatidyltransferase ['Fragaria x ananassa' phyllody phytoplasma]